MAAIAHGLCERGHSSPSALMKSVAVIWLQAWGMQGGGPERV